MKTQKKTQKFTPSFFSLLNFNEIRCKQSNENDQMASVFCYSQILYMNIRDKFFPRVKSEIQIREKFFPRNLKNPKSAKLNSHKNLLPHGFRRCGNCERLCLSCNLSAFVSRFQQSRIRELRKFFGQESHRPLPQVRKCPYAYGCLKVILEPVYMYRQLDMTEMVIVLFPISSTLLSREFPINISGSMFE